MYLCQSGKTYFSKLHCMTCLVDPWRNNIKSILFLQVCLFEFVSQSRETSKDKQGGVLQELVELRNLTLSGLEKEKTEIDEQRRIINKEREQLEKVIIKQLLNVETQPTLYL